MLNDEARFSRNKPTQDVEEGRKTTLGMKRRTRPRPRSDLENASKQIMLESENITARVSRRRRNERGLHESSVESIPEPVAVKKKRGGSHETDVEGHRKTRRKPLKQDEQGKNPSASSK